MNDNSHSQFPNSVYRQGYNFSKIISGPENKPDYYLEDPSRNRKCLCDAKKGGIIIIMQWRVFSAVS